MSWKIWKWIKTRKQLLDEKQELIDSLDKAKVLIDKIHSTLKYTILDSEIAIGKLKQESAILLGAIALQHQGEILVKDDFIQMLYSPDYNLKIITERNDEEHGLCIKVIEEKANHAEEKK